MSDCGFHYVLFHMTSIHDFPISPLDLTHLTGSSDGYLLTLNRKDGKLQWKRDFQSPIVAIYLIQHEGLLRVPFTTLASDMLSGIISRLSVDVWKANFIGERKLLLVFFLLHLLDLASNDF